MVCLVHLVCFVYLVGLVHLVSLVYLVDLVQPKNQTDQIDQTKQINQTDQTNQARAEVPGSKFRKPRTSNSRSFRRPITQNPELRTQNSELPCPSRSFVVQ